MSRAHSPIVEIHTIAPKGAIGCKSGLSETDRDETENLHETPTPDAKHAPYEGRRTAGSRVPEKAPSNDDHF